MPDKAKTILAEEESFARRAALGVVVRRPVKAWMQLIPGMFIFDFLKRTQEIRRFSEYYLYPRRHALQAVQEIARGNSRDAILDRFQEQCNGWLSARHLYSGAASQALVRAMNLLIDHYDRLFRCQGDTYFALVRNAYTDQETYEYAINQLNAAEREVAQAIADSAPESEFFWKEIPARHAQVEEFREKDSEAIFFGQ